MRAAFVVFVMSLVARVLVACGPDLGNCDADAAKTIVYLNGTPYVEGQALVYQSCAGSTCHASGAVGAGRTGAPHGLNFDVQPLTKTAKPKDLSVLRAGINEVRGEAEELWAVIDSGEMPPGKAGDRPDLPWFYDAAGTKDAMLTGVDLAEARDKVRNWLACQAPIVAATSDSPLAGQAKAMQLGSVMDPGTSSINATFESIYDNLLTTCVGCHGATSPYPNQALNLSSRDAAYMSLVKKKAFAGTDAQCAKRTLVTPGDCDTSLLYQKLTLTEEDSGELCGKPMPLGGAMISDATQKAVCDWITAGALP